MTIAGGVRLLLFSALALWLGYNLARTLVFAVQSWGPLAGLTDAVFLFRLGEALVILALAAYLLVPAGAAGRGILHPPARWIVLAGALLSGVSFLGLDGRIRWALLAVIVAALGLLAALLVGSSRLAARRAAGFGLALLVLLHLAGLAAGFFFHGYTIVPYPAAPPPAAGDRDERWRQDVRYMGSELARMHRNVYHTISAGEYWDAVRSLEERVPLLSDGQIAVEMMRFVASIGDAHTEFNTQGNVPLRGLPIDLRWYGGGLYVRGISPDYPEAVGRRVLKIGPLEAEQVYQAALPYISHENDAWARVKSPYVLNLTDLLVKIGAAEENRPVLFTFEDANGQPFSMEIAPFEPGQTANFLSAVEQRPFYNSRPNQPFWYEYRPATRTLYFRYAACVEPLAFRQVAGEMWQVADKQPVERLIIDLRGNSGGNTFQLERFWFPGLKEHPELDDPQRLFVLIDRVTFSSASDNAVFLRQHTRATLAGEPAGGQPNGYGEVRSFSLPNSRTSVSYSTRYFQSAGEGVTSLVPDLLIPVSRPEAFAGQDPVLQAIAPGEEWQP